MENVPPGLKPSSARTPPPSATGGIPVEPAARPPPAAPAVAPVRAPTTGTAQAAKPAPAARPPPPPPVPTERPAPPVPDAPAVARPAAPAAATRPAPAASRFGLTVVAGATRGQRYKLPVTGCVVGRSRGAILLQEDAFVSALHATFLVKEGALFIRDESSASGVYVTIPGTEAIAPRTLFSAGSRLFRFSGRLEIPIAQPGQPVIYGAPVPLGQAIYVVEEVLMGGRAGRAVVSAAALLTIGQAHCDLSYPQDEGLASRHCELSPTATGAMLRDLSGGLGTYVRIAPATERALRAGDRVRIGQTIFQIEALG
ncbi:FHA domain-containing protein [Hyalangium rubrum]|uniref:FHA domain-containing protein n=1 Tax=Hyalangium rubrum TaxID=3103134 RepID=A0ABU5HD10_9BACT|nr:FHA domain-containing protein [Hyalangium sp. s54d21]MDY7230774.1 FHA domain-containing protein [Hyalangium sp. s54d21]